MLILSLLLIMSSPFMPTTEAINCFNCTIASEGSQSVDQCKNFDSQTPTCPPSQYCISFSGIMHEESKVIDSKIYTCDTVLYQNHFSWALKGKIKTIRHAQFTIWLWLVLVQRKPRTFARRLEMDVTILEIRPKEGSQLWTWKCAAVTPTCKILIFIQDNYQSHKFQFQLQ